MASKTRVTVTHDKEVTVDLKAQYQATTDLIRSECVLLDNLFRALASGSRNGSMIVAIDDGNEAYAAGTITFTGAGAANDTILINGTTFTAVASGATGNQWNVGGTATLTAANVAAAITASATALVNTTVTATSALGVVTITAAKPGAMGNSVTIAKGTDAGSVMTASGARLTGGLEPTTQTSVTYSK